MRTLTRNEARSVIRAMIPVVQLQHSRSRTNVDADFQAKYYYDPAGFIRDCFRWENINDEPTKYQLEIAQQLIEDKRITVRGPHGLGKTALSAWLILWFALTRDGRDWKCPTTASAWRQLKEYLWPEIHKWSRELRWELTGRPAFNGRYELHIYSLTLATGSAFAVASNQPAKIEGAHADHILYIFDEAKTIPGATYDAAEGAFSGSSSQNAREAYAFAPSTPGEPQGRFFDMHSRKSEYSDWVVRHVRKEEAVEAGRVTEEWTINRKTQWGADSAIYMNRVEGEFAASEADTVIPLAWIELANERWQAIKENPTAYALHTKYLSTVGVDVARSGKDKSVIALNHFGFIDTLRKLPREDTMQCAGRIAAVLDKYSIADKPDFEKPRAIIDIIGLGAGVYDRLREQEYHVVPFTANNRTNKRDEVGEFRFVNVRSAAWWRLRELLDPRSHNPIALPPDDDLQGELLAPKWTVNSGARIDVESKDKLKKRLDGRSTDSADAVVMAMWDPANEIMQLPQEMVRAINRYTGTSDPYAEVST